MYIKGFAFFSCKKLKKITILYDSILEIIGEKAFYNSSFGSFISNFIDEINLCTFNEYKFNINPFYACNNAFLTEHMITPRFN